MPKIPVPITSIPGTPATYEDFEESDAYHEMTKVEKMRYQKAKWWKQHKQLTTNESSVNA